MILRLAVAAGVLRRRAAAERAVHWAVRYAFFSQPAAVCCQ